MGNITKKEINADVCLHFFINHLIEKHYYRLMDKLEPTVENIEVIIRKSFLQNQIIQYGDMYFFRLENETKERLAAENCLIAPFVYQICDSEALDRDSAVQQLMTRGDRIPKLPSSITYVIAYSQLNWCQVIGILIVKFRWNPFTHQVEPVISMICSHSPNNNIARRRLEQANNIDCQDTDNLSPEQRQLCDNLYYEAIKKSKLGLGIIMMFRALKDLKAEGYKYVHLQADTSNWQYYVKKLQFKLGPSPDILAAYTTHTNGGSWPKVKKQYISPIALDMSLHHTFLPEKWKEYQDVMKQPSLEYFLSVHHPFVHLLSYPVTNKSYVYLHIDLQTFHQKQMMETILQYKPNLKAILDSSEIFIMNDDMIKLDRAVELAHCLNQFFVDQDYL